LHRRPGRDGSLGAGDGEPVECRGSAPIASLYRRLADEGRIVPAGWVSAQAVELAGEAGPSRDMISQLVVFTSNTA